MTNHEYIEAERALYDEENKQNDSYRRYARGKQPSMLTEKQEKILGPCKGKDRSDNICHQIIAEASDRLELLGFEVDNAQVQAYLNDLYVKNAIADLQGEVHYNTARDGNAAVFVEWKPAPSGKPSDGRVRLHLHDWWDGVQGVFISSGGDGQEPFAVKDRLVSLHKQADGETITQSIPTFADNVNGVYTTTRAVSLLAQTFVRRYVYYDDRIEKYERPFNAVSLPGAETWQPYIDPADQMGGVRFVDGERHIISWTKADGVTPLHIPYVHFANAGRMLGYQGIAELSGGVLNFQDEINQIQSDGTVTALLTAFRILWLRGFTPIPDPNNLGKFLAPAFPDFEPGVLLQDSSKEFEVGAVEAGSMDQIVTAHNLKLTSVARSTRTPRHAITGGDWPSGDALERAERPSRAKAKRQAAKSGVAWATVMHRAVEQANVFGKANLDENALIFPKWGAFGEEAQARTGAAGEAGTENAQQNQKGDNQNANGNNQSAQP